MYDSFSSLIYASTASMIVKTTSKKLHLSGNIIKSHYLCYRYAFRASHDGDGALPNYLRKVSLPNLRRRVILFRESLCKESASRKAHRHRSYMRVTSGVETD